jgi:phospholipase D1/2
MDEVARQHDTHPSGNAASHEHRNGYAHIAPQIHLSPATEDHAERQSIISSIRSRVSKIFHLDPSKGRNASASDGRRRASSTSRAGVASSGSISSELSDDDETISTSSRVQSRPATPMLDPSTNANPLLGENEEGMGKDGPEKTKESDKEKRFKKLEGDVSKHIFYIVNSQMRLKLIAKNEVGWFSCSSLRSVCSLLTTHSCSAPNAAVHYGA